MNWTILPILIPLSTALLALFWWKPSFWRRVVVAGSAVGQLVVAVGFVVRTCAGDTFVLVAGAWTAPFGIVLVIDPLTAVMLALSALVALASIVFGYTELSSRVEHPLRLPLTQFLVLGMNQAFCTGDLFNLFVAFEITLIASYALLTLEADDWDVKQAFPYLAINLVGSTLFLCAAGLAYTLFGTLNFADIAMRSAGMAGDPRVTALGLLLMVVFGVKAGLFPLYYWLPNSYPTLPTPLAGLYAGLLTKVGVYVLLRVFGTVLPHGLDGIHHLLAWLAAATMIFGVLGAISRNFIRGILSYHILSQVGFMVLAIGLFTPLSFAACIFYVIHHIVVKSSLFLIGGVGACLNRTDNLDRMGNLWRHTPWLGVLFLFQALSLSGLPPLSGFWGKYAIMVVGLEQRAYVLVGAAVVASLLTLFSMLKIWNGAFWNSDEEREVCLWDLRWTRMCWVAAVMTVVSLGIGLGAEGIFRVAQEAASRALDQQGYARIVFEHAGKGAGLTP